MKSKISTKKSTLKSIRKSTRKSLRKSTRKSNRRSIKSLRKKRITKIYGGMDEDPLPQRDRKRKRGEFQAIYDNKVEKAKSDEAREKERDEDVESRAKKSKIKKEEIKEEYELSDLMKGIEVDDVKTITDKFKNIGKVSDKK